ncbi:DUF6063 family protein [Heliorestis convoluta]|uniref:Non-ribosomal peptide synthetase module n=1 Tax=Heliorestis convoluta TaxID=356322 RepID=A0A5Q2N408_9FIRM|nr:DUF6063 family protein [Heliorestis convoluta]QGG48633.1 hypothetical protein FTV88_2540 [Heliorestis convoluta]
MILYSHEQTEQTFRLLVQLLRQGQLNDQHPSFHDYRTSSEVRSLAEDFAKELDSVIIKTSDHLYLIPRSGQSPFALKNAWIKRDYLGTGATNVDLYMMYFAIIVFFGEFYDSYESPEATRDFLSLSDWMIKIRERLDTLKEQGREKLENLEGDTEWNWLAVIDYWDNLDDLKEKAKRQDSRQQSRLGFLKKVIRFLEDQGLAQSQGRNEFFITEKAKIIVQRYFMDREHNRDLLAFMYQYDQAKGENSPASHLQDTTDQSSV